MRLSNLFSRRNFLSSLPGLSVLGALSGARAMPAGRLEDGKLQQRMIDRYPAFKDKRGKKVVFVPHCLLNQNARCNNSGNFPASIPLIPEYLLERKIGIAQMPCPELGCLGLGREGLIYDQLSTPGSRQYLKKVAADVTYQIGQYLKHKFTVIAVLGIDCSPCCGVSCHAYNGAQPGKGAFMEELSLELEREGIQMPLIGVADRNPGEALDKLKALES